MSKISGKCVTFLSACVIMNKRAFSAVNFYIKRREITWITIIINQDQEKELPEKFSAADSLPHSQLYSSYSS